MRNTFKIIIMMMFCFKDVIRHYIMDVNNDGYDDLVIKKRNSLSNSINLYTYKGSAYGFNSDAVTTDLPC